MNIKKYQVFLFSQKPDKLKDFYVDALGFEILKKLDIPDDYGYKLKLDEMEIWIGKHSEVQNYNPDPFRIMINFYTDDIKGWFDKLKNRKDIKIIAEPFQNPSSNQENPRYAFTFLDPEGNCIQFMD